MSIEIIQGDSTHIADSRCPTCGHKLSAATNPIDMALPTPGDVSICFYCGELLQYDALLHSQRLSDSARQDLIHNQPEDWAYMLAMQAKFRKASEKYLFLREPKVQ